MSLEDVWHARPQLFFKCILLSQNGRPPKNPSCTRGPDDLEATLVFSALLRSSSCRPQGPWIVPPVPTTKLYEPSSTPILYVAPCELMLGRVPLFPCFLQGNTTPAIPHKLRHLKTSAFQYGIANATAVDGRRGSNVYEVKPWLWQFGRGRPRLGGLSVSETEDRREAVVRWGKEESRDPPQPRGRRGDE